MSFIIDKAVKAAFFIGLGAKLELSAHADASG